MSIRSIFLDRACGYMVLVLVYAASLPSLLNILTEPWQRGVVMAVLGAGLLGLAALFLLDHLPRPLMGLRLIAPIAELSRESRRLFTHPARCGAVLGLSALSGCSSIRSCPPVSAATPFAPGVAASSA